jgi:CubicO group peptidase (beta-lactamase class C family)
MRLAENKLISLDENVNDKLRGWKVPDNEYTAQEKVTPGRIISHMAGLSLHGFVGYKQDAKIPSLTQILDGLPPANSAPVQVTAIPGTREIYSGGGFVLLQLLMQELTGEPFETLMKELILQPAGMTQSDFALLFPANMASLAANGYHQNGEMVEGGHYLHPELAPAGLWTTPSDLARFLLSIGNSYRNGSGILKKETARSMLTRVPNGSGMGFGLDGEGEVFRFRHNGQNDGFSCYAVSFAGIGRGVVIMTNTDQGDQLCMNLSGLLRANTTGLPCGEKFKLKHNG